MILIYCFLPNHDGPEIMYVILSINNAKCTVNYLFAQTKETQKLLTFLFTSLSTSRQCEYPLEYFPSSRLKECKEGPGKLFILTQFN